jgi:Tfp pilus assembly protein PilN
VKALFCLLPVVRCQRQRLSVKLFEFTKQERYLLLAKNFLKQRATNNEQRTIYKTVITKLNLASRPFRNRTLPYLIALVLLAFSVGGAILCFAELRDIGNNNELAKKDIVDIEAKLKELNNKGELVQQDLSPDQKALLIGAHKLVANKSFGWSKLFSDLENVLPGGVSASRISVENIFKDGDRVKAELDFAVLSRDYQSVAAMIDNMNNSGVFKAELRGQDLQKTDRLTFSEYTLHLIYTPYYSLPATNPSDLAQQGGDQ